MKKNKSISLASSKEMRPSKGDNDSGFVTRDDGRVQGMMVLRETGVDAVKVNEALEELMKGAEAREFRPKDRF